MSFEHRTTDDLIRVAAAGGGFTLTATHRTTNDLIRIAAAASGKGSRLTFTGLTHRTTDDLIRISAASKGCVVLEG
ncbi:hypothetical protein GGR63_002642 [Xanthomonas sp. 3272]|uniref:hypothetical protein n=1 Tax=Xanthomonas arboricola TaxID=56448 RepID=UPI00143228EA|nr:hypothetical protein [Xanthomonas arboricola]NJC02695.1 hypothetical protein [Xanthomonas arboricola]